ncbi:MAG: hypothetical protein LQ340_001612 [Diploschistes diacapsis]|nr:MAG: hypothetical protein LQ340_001612 [Diploschistes diacapsis]
MSTAETLDANGAKLPEAVLEALEFEREQWANGPASQDPFYSLESYSGQEPPGTLLKVEKACNTKLWMLPPTTALSRFVYQSETLNAKPVPVSGYILWPYSPRSSEDGYHVVAFAHGTTGLEPNYAPSNTKNLAHHFIQPYQLALQGYVVVATDYAGLGVSKDSNGQRIVHPYGAHPAHANDVVYSVQAAREAFPELSKRFVVAGYSQGGGAAWSVAQRQAASPIEGYLGAVAICPITRILEYQEPIRSIVIAAVTPAIESILPGFTQAEILTEVGQQTLALCQRAGASLTTLLSLLGKVQARKDDAIGNGFLREFQSLTSNGGKKIAGPLLVIQGESDPMVNHPVTERAVRDTITKHPDAQLEYILVPGVGHKPAVFSTQWIWTDWIADRFSGAQATSKGSRTLKSALPLQSYQPALNWWLAPETKFYHAP